MSVDFRSISWRYRPSTPKFPYDEMWGSVSTESSVIPRMVMAIGFPSRLCPGYSVWSSVGNGGKLNTFQSLHEAMDVIHNARSIDDIKNSTPKTLNESEVS